MLTRRQVLAGTASLPIALSANDVFALQATPAATPMVPGVPASEDVVPAWLDAQAALTELGEAASQSFWASDTDALIAIANPEVAAGLEDGFSPEVLVESYVHNQIQFAFPEVGAWFFGQYSSDRMSGAFLQGGPISWEAVPDEPQSGEVPTGTWSGTIGPGVIDLGIQLEFSGGMDDFAVYLSIPSQFLMNQPMTNVVLAEEIPIGEVTDKRIIPAGGDVTLANMYAEQYAWGANTLMLLSVWSGDGQLAGLNFVPQGALPLVQAPEAIVARLPFDGAWIVVWGGDTEFRNYHAPVPAQRYAADILLWRDGSTAVAPGTDNQHYHAFGQPYLAPVSGTVASVLDGLDDIAPQSEGNPGDHAAGNHIVIETDGGFVFLAHCQNGSILVEPGDSVTTGDVVAAVGNSGNTSESHVHIHAQTSDDLYDPEAIGIPLVYENVLVDGDFAESTSLLHGTIVEQSS